MVYAPHVRMTVQGSFRPSLILPTYEIWSTSLAIAVPGGGTLPATGPGLNDTLWADMAEDFRVFLSSVGAAPSNGLSIDSFKAATIGADGSYTAEPTIVDYGPVMLGGTGAIGKAPQTALAVSLNTTAPLDRVKGRMYLPAPAYVPQDDGRISPANAAAAANAAATFINNINNQPGIDQSPGTVAVVASTKGTNWKIDAVRVGRVLDTIRTRRNQMVEDYSQVAIA